MSLWAIAYDLDTTAIDADNQNNAGPTRMTVYNRVRRVLRDHGFEFTQYSIYTQTDEAGSLNRLHRCLNALNALAESRHFTRLHVFQIDSSIHDVLPEVDGRPSAGQDPDTGADADEAAEAA